MLPLVTNHEPNQPERYPPSLRYIRLTRPKNFILVPNPDERFGWACVVTRSEIWSELPLEINRMIVNLLVNRRYECLSCGKFECDKEHEYYCIRCDIILKRWKRQINRGEVE
jgi:hypothetical protein